MATFKTDYITRTKTNKGTGKVWLLFAQNRCNVHECIWVIRQNQTIVQCSAVSSTFERELGDGFLSYTTWILHNVAQLLCDA